MPRTISPAHTLALAVVAVVLVLTAGGCSTTRFAIGTMVPVLDEATAFTLASGDAELVREAVPANLVLLEGMIRTDPRPDLLVMAAQIYFSYAFAFVEDEEPERALAMYLKGRDHGLRALAERRPVARALASADVVALEKALDDLGRDEVPALFWTAAAWAAWINLNLESPAAIADLSLVEALLQRVVELDERFEWGMPQLLLGVFYGGRPPILGGDPELGLVHFRRAGEIADGKLLLVPLFEARYYAVQTLNEDLFTSRLEEVLATPADILPPAQLLNVVAQEKAAALLAARDEIF